MILGGKIPLIVAATLWLAPAVLAQTTPVQGLPCLKCHRPSDTTIDPDRYAHSVHQALDCTVCHTEGFDSFPHKGSRASMPNCVDCHSGPATPPIDFDQIAQAVQQSIHVKVVDPAFRCTSCHSPHYFIPASRMTNAAEATLAANRPCLGCHAAGDTPTAKQTAFKTLAEKHRLFPHWELHIQRNMCVACHTPRDKQTVHLILPKSEALRDCAACHARNSLLATKLYSHLAIKERAEHGWMNAVLINNAYLTGATRNRWLDWAGLGLAVLTLLGVGAHGGGRLLFAGWRRKRS
jgi:hypothetical protein